MSESYFFSSAGGDDDGGGAHCQTLTLPSLTSLHSLAAAAVVTNSAAVMRNSFIPTSPNADCQIAPVWFLALPPQRQTSPNWSAGSE